MQMVIPRRRLAPAAVIVVLATLAGCATGGGGAAAGKASTVEVSAVASRSAAPEASAKLSAAASASAKPSSGASTASAPAPTTVAPTPRGKQTAATLLDSALSAMLAKQSVHLACTTTSSTGVSTESMGVGVASGRDASSEGDVSIVNMLVDGIAYISTNTAGIFAAQGIPQAEAEKLAGGEWLSIRPGQSYGHVYLDYSNAIEGMTIADQADFLRLTGSLKRTGATWAQGASVYGVSGDAPPSAWKGATTESVYIAATGAPLPVSVTVHLSSGTRTCDFSGWDEPLNLTAPGNVVPITAIPK